MGYLAESAIWPIGVRYFEANAVLTGGPNCPDNLPIGDLANRTVFLKKQIDDAVSGALTMMYAQKLKTGRTISLSGDATGSVAFDGSANVTIPVVVADYSHNHTIANVDGLQTALDAKAPLASPVLTGNPTAPTPTTGDNDTSIATTAFVQALVNGRLVKSVAGGVTVTLTPAEAGYGIIEFTGALTASIAVVMPNVTSQWIIKNSTTGAYTLTVKTAAGTGVIITQGAAWQVYCDGANVVDGISDFKDLALTGVPTAPTAAAGTNTTQLATTGFVLANTQPLRTDLGGAVDLNTITANGLYHQPANANAASGTNYPVGKAGLLAVLSSSSMTYQTYQEYDTGNVWTRSKYGAWSAWQMSAQVASPVFTGNPTAPTPTTGDNDTSIATTAFVQALVNGRLSKSVAGGATVTLTAPEAGYGILEFTGALTANIAVVVPNATGQWIVKNATTGAFTLTVKTAAGTGVIITQGTAWQVYCDGANVVDGISDFKDIALTGTPTAPTAAAGTSTTQLATTAFVQAAAVASAAKLTAARTISLSGDATGSIAFDGSANVTIPVTVADDSHNHLIANVDGLQTALDAKAPLASPALTGTPTTPTAAAGTNSTQLANTAFVQSAIAALIASSPATLDTLNELATALGNDPNFATTMTNALAAKAPLANPVLTGNPTAPTPTTGDNDTSIATTAFVQALVNGRLVKSVAGGVTVTLTAVEAGYGIIEFTGALTASIAVVMPNVTGQWIIKNATTGAYTLTVKTAAGTGVIITQGAAWQVYCDGANVVDGISDFKDLALTGVPTAPTAAAGTNTTQLATTAFVLAAAVASAARLSTARTISLSGDAVGSIAFDGSANVTIPVVVADYSHNHTVANVDGLQTALDAKAPLASPALTGTPTAPTAAAGTSSTQLATTAFVQQELAGDLATAAPLMDGVATVGTSTKLARENHVHPTDTTRAPLASPALTGTPTAPTAAAGTSSTQLATTAFVQAANAVATPPGSIGIFPMSTAPAGWLKANGAAVSRTTYAALFAAIGVTHGAGDGSTTFNLPDLRGEFVRGWDDGRGVDSGRTLGSWQGMDMQSHSHGLLTNFDGTAYNGLPYRAAGGDGAYAGQTPTVQTDNVGGSETRPRNVAQLFCIKF